MILTEKDLYFINNKGICPCCGKLLVLIGCINKNCAENKKRRKIDSEFNDAMIRYEFIGRKIRASNAYYEDIRKVVFNRNIDNAPKKFYSISI